MSPHTPRLDTTQSQHYQRGPESAAKHVSDKRPGSKPNFKYLELPFLGLVSSSCYGLGCLSSRATAAAFSKANRCEGLEPFQVQPWKNLRCWTIKHGSKWSSAAETGVVCSSPSCSWLDKRTAHVILHQILSLFQWELWRVSGAFLLSKRT